MRHNSLTAPFPTLHLAGTATHNINNSMRSEMAPIHGLASEHRSGHHGDSSRNGGRSRKASAGKGLAENSSQVTAEDGTPSPGDMDHAATSGSFFAFQSGDSEGSDSVSGGLVPDRAGHRRQGSKSASISSGFAGVAGVGGGGIGGGSMNGAPSTHSAGSRRSSTGSKSSSRAGKSRSRSRGRSPSEAPEMMSPGLASRGGAVSRAIASGVRAGVRRMNSRGDSVRVGSSATARGVGVPPTGTRRTGFAQFLSKDSAEDIDAGSASPSSSRPARKQKTKAKTDIRKTWGLRQETMESEDNIEFENPEAFKHTPMPKPNGDRRGTSGVREATPSSPEYANAESPPTATATATATAPTQGGVKRYSWAQRMASTDLDFEAGAAPQQEPPRTPERGRDGIRSSLSRSSMDSEDDMVCSSPATRNAILNSRIGARRRGDIVDEYANSVIRRRPAAGGAMAGIRAAWGTSMGGSQDDIMCPSPQAVNAVRNPTVKGAYARGIVDDEGSEAEPEYVDPRSLGPGVPGSRRRPVGDTFAGIRAAWGTSVGGSQDDIMCASPSAINMVRNSRAAAKKSAPVKIQLDDDSCSEEEEAQSRSLGSGIVGSRRRPAAAVGGNQDMICASPATVNAILNSRVGAVYSRGGDGGRPAANTAARPPKIVSAPARSRRPKSERHAGGSGSGSGSGSGKVGRGQGAGSEGVRGGGGDRAAADRGRGDTEAGRKKTSGSRRGEAGQGRDKTAGTRRDEAGQRRDRTAGKRDQTARGRDQPAKGREKSARGGDQPASGRDQPSRGREKPSRGRDKPSRGRDQPAGNRGGEAAGAGRGGAAVAVDAAAARRRWSPGQSNVFDSSGSSSSDDEGKPRGLRGVRVLDSDPSETEMRGSGGTIRGGGAAAGSGGGAGGGGRRATGVGHAYRGPGGGVPTVGSSLAGVVTGGGGGAAARVPRRETLKGMPGLSRGLSEDDSEYSFDQAHRD